MKIEEFREYLKIDKNALDEEIIRQPSLLYEVSEAYAMAGAERDRCKEELALTDAEQDKLVRATAADEDDKLTEAQVKSKVAYSDAHMDAAQAWLDAKLKADKLFALKDAFQQRSYMLRDLVSLYTANYFEQEAVKTTASQDRVVFSRRRARIDKGSGK